MSNFDFLMILIILMNHMIHINVQSIFVNVEKD